MDEWGLPLKSVETRGSASQAMIPLRVVDAAFLEFGAQPFGIRRFFKHRRKIHSPKRWGWAPAMHSRQNAPPIQESPGKLADAAPVDVGMMFNAAAPGAPGILVGQIQQTLIGGICMHGGHIGLFDAENLVDDLGRRHARQLSGTGAHWRPHGVCRFDSRRD